MFLNASVKRFAHMDGFTFCTYSEDGKIIITCGYDGDVRRWQSINDDDPISTCLGEFITNVVQYDNRLLACTDLNTVYTYTFPEIERDGIKFRFTAPATCVKVNKKFIAAGSEDTVIKVVERDDISLEFELEGHQAPVLSIDLNEKYQLASSSGDGTIKIWDLKEKKAIKTITGLSKVNSFELAKLFVTPIFDPKTGDYLAYCDGNEIVLLNCINWDVKTKLKNDKITSDFTCCAFSNCGKYIAAGTVNGEIIVFDIENKKSFVSNQDAQHSITSISWNPKNNNEFAYCDLAGHLRTIIIEKKNHQKSSSSSSSSLPKRISSENGFIDSEAAEENRENDENYFDGSNLGEDNNGDNSNDSCISLEKIKNETMARFGIGNDDNGGGSNYDVNDDLDDRKTPIKNYMQQKPFQPGATPEEDEHRYLAWNNVGIVRAHKDNDGVGSIDVEFHDSNLHHPIHMSNYMNHTMASLSSSVIALSSYDSTKLVCITLDGSGSREWSIELPDCEGIMALAATTKLIAVATTNHFIRIFSVMGTQREVIIIPGPVVAMCGYENRLMITFHSTPATEDQHISAIILQTFGLTIHSREIRVPITPGKKLAWIGYSDKGSPLCYDTMGFLRMYNMKTNCWYPVCDTMKHSVGVSNNFYIVDVLESTQIIQGVLCSGSSYPLVKQRPLVTEIPMRLPLCEIESDKSMLEESLIRLSNFSVDNSDRIIKETGLKLFALACRTEMEARAKELIEMIASPHLLSLATKYATNLGRIHLAEKLSEMLPQVEEQEREREKQIRENDMEVLSSFQNSSFNESLMLLQRNKTSNTTVQTPTQKIAPKPMVIKRNPFKKSTPTTSTPSNKNSSLIHLTENIIGHETINTEQEQQQQTKIQNEQITSSEIFNKSLSESINRENDEISSSFVDNTNKNTSSRENFINWFSKNKDKLKEKYTEIDDKELSKIALKEFRQVVNEEKEIKNSSKRKLDENSDDKKSSSSTGISKLAKFEFFK